MHLHINYTINKALINIERHNITLYTTYQSIVALQADGVHHGELDYATNDGPRPLCSCRVPFGSMSLKYLVRMTRW